MAFAFMFGPEQYDALRWMRLEEIVPDIVMSPSGSPVTLFHTAGYPAYAGTLLGLTVVPMTIAWLVVKRRLG